MDGQTGLCTWRVSVFDTLNSKLLLPPLGLEAYTLSLFGLTAVVVKHKTVLTVQESETASCTSALLDRSPGLPKGASTASARRCCGWL